MTKEQFYEEMEKLDELKLKTMKRFLGWIIEDLPSEVSRAMQLTKFDLLLEDLIDKKEKEGG